MPDDAFSQLVDQFYPSLYRFALSMARSEADACDLTQQTFYIWAQKGHALREAAKAKSWLFTTLYREFLRSRRRGERLTALESIPESQLEDVALEPETVAALDGSAVLEALQRVDELFRAPLTLFYLEMLSYQEIADALDVPVGTVMSRLSRGKAQLRACLSSRTVSTTGKVVSLPLNKKASHG
ncbi:RNA polymerase subunit sigma-24 [Opitutaceae bacterium EW11]|nr:RNA polymerase subunit sigma-24 [Opitutaceae bacterium EW11]